MKVSMKSFKVHVFVSMLVVLVVPLYSKKTIYDIYNSTFCCVFGHGVYDV